MSFFSLKFLIFFLLILLLLHKARSAERQQVILLVAGFVFYGFWDWRLLSLLIAVSLVVWQAAKYAVESKRALLAGVTIPLLSLGVCKYLGFFYDSFIALLGLSASGTLQIILPLGISFYTFLAISYLLDVYHGKILPVL